MELDIAALSMNMAAANLQQGVSIGMMKKTMESTQQTMETITDMLDSIPSPDGKGTVLNVRAGPPRNGRYFFDAQRGNYGRNNAV